MKNILVVSFAALVAAQQQSDGQITASTSLAGQKTDGQITVPTSVPTVAPVSQITDGQIQVTTAAPVVPVSQISDGQIQGPTAVSSGHSVPSGNASTIAPVTPSPSAFTGAANIMAWSNVAVVGVVGVAALAFL